MHVRCFPNQPNPVKLSYSLFQSIQSLERQDNCPEKINPSQHVQVVNLSLLKLRSPILATVVAKNTLPKMVATLPAYLASGLEKPCQHLRMCVLFGVHIPLRPSCPLPLEPQIEILGYKG